MPAVDILILRDGRESRAKCSLTPLHGLPGVRFVPYDPEQRLDGAGRLLLHADGELLGDEDRGRDLLLIDCCWRRVQKLLATVDGPLHARRLPALVTAYPRRSKTYRDPEQGLASVEALYAATVLLGAPRPDFLRGYRWQREFLRSNPELVLPRVGAR